MGRRFRELSIINVSEEEHDLAVYLDYWVVYQLKQFDYLTFGKINFDLSKKSAAYNRPKDLHINEYYFIGLDEGNLIIRAFVPLSETGDLFDTVMKCLKAIWKQKGWPIEDINKIVEQKDNDVTFTVTKKGSVKVGVECGPHQTQILLFTRKLGKEPLELMKVRPMDKSLYQLLFHDIEVSEEQILIYNITKDIVHKVDFANRKLTVEILTDERAEELLLGFIGYFHPDMTWKKGEKAFRSYMNS